MSVIKISFSPAQVANHLSMSKMFTPDNRSWLKLCVCQKYEFVSEKSLHFLPPNIKMLERAILFHIERMMRMSAFRWRSSRHPPTISHFRQRCDILQESTEVLSLFYQTTPRRPKGQFTPIDQRRDVPLILGLQLRKERLMQSVGIRRPLRIDV